MSSDVAKTALAVRAVLYGPKGEFQGLDEACMRALERVARRYGLTATIEPIRSAVPPASGNPQTKGSSRAANALSDALAKGGPAALAAAVDKRKRRRSRKGYRSIPVST